LASILALAAAVTLFAVFPSAAFAEPGEGGNSKQLIQNLEAAARGYVEAESALEASRAKQVMLKRELDKVEVELGPLRKEVAAIAATAYQNGRLNAIGAMLASQSSDDFLSRAMFLEEINQRENDELGRLVRLEARARADKASIDAEAAIQKATAANLRKRVDALQLMLSKSGGSKATLNWPLSLSPTAAPARRNRDGSLPGESCSVSDPTGTGGCITPRTLHALREAKRFGFTRFTKCWRTQSWGEHPKGRACDFSSEMGGFGGNAAGGDRVYGDKLAAFFIKNAKALGVLYVIWYRMIWLPGVGWHGYSGCCGASAEHTNHVHLSMQ
jgi:hypothetical protein